MTVAAAIAGAARQAIKRTSRVVVVVVGEYPIIELHIRVAIEPGNHMAMLSCTHKYDKIPSAL